MDKETKNMFEAKALLKAQRTLLTFPEKTYNQYHDQHWMGPATASASAPGF
jgi:hypothetical protein